MANETKAIIEELKFLLSQSKQVVVRNILEDELSKQNVLLKSVTPKSKPIVKSGTQTKNITNYAWDEGNQFVKIYVTKIKEADDIIEKDSIESNFETRSFNVFLRKVGSKSINYSLSILNLCKNISPSDCSIKTTKTGVTISLKKASVGMWGNLKAVKEDKKEDPMPKMDKDADPSSGMMNLMKQMYESGDDEMKRTIAKSMYESQQKQQSGETGGMPDMGGMGAGMPGMPGMGGMGAGMPDMSGMGAGMPDMSSMGAGLPDMGSMGTGFDGF